MELRFLPMLTRRKLVYKVTYPNGKIYVGVDFIGTSVSYFGSPSQKAKDAIAADHADCRHDMTVRKEILWECETATDAEARAKETELIVALGANNPKTGYNRTPRFKPPKDVFGT